MLIVKPETLIGWHRKGFKLFSKGKSQASRPMFLHLCLLASQAGGTGPPEGLSEELEHVCPQSFAEHRRLRFPGCGDHSISNSLCVHPHEGWREAHRTLKRHAYPTAVWTLQQFREAISSDYSYCFLIRDRDSIFSTELDQRLNK